MVKRLVVLMAIVVSSWAAGPLKPAFAGCTETFSLLAIGGQPGSRNTIQPAVGSFEDGLGWMVGKDWYYTLRGNNKRITDSAAQNHQSIVYVSNSHYFEGHHSAYGFSSVRTDETWSTWEHVTRTILSNTLDLTGRTGIRLRVWGQKSMQGGVWGWCNEIRLRLSRGTTSAEFPLWVNHEAPFAENGNHRVRKERGADGAWWDVYEVPIPNSMRAANVSLGILISSDSWRNYLACSSMEAYIDGIETY